MDRGYGDNSGAPAPAAEVDALQQQKDKLLAGATRFHEQHAVIADDETHGRATDFANQIKKFVKRVEAARVIAREPSLEAGRVVDASFSAIKQPLQEAVAAIAGKLQAYMTQKAMTQRAARMAEAARLQAEADAAAAIARENGSSKAFDAAIAAAKDAETAERRANAPAAELARGRGALGSTSTLRETWDFEVLELGAVPAEFVQIDASRVRTAIAAGVREIAGLRIFSTTKVSIR